MNEPIKATKEPPIMKTVKFPLALSAVRKLLTKACTQMDSETKGSDEPTAKINSLAVDAESIRVGAKSQIQRSPLPAVADEKNKTTAKSILLSCLYSVIGFMERVQKSPNAPKLSDRGGRRAGCAGDRRRG